MNDIKEIIKVFSDNNLFEEGISLIGSWCFRLYQKHLGADKYPLRTQDIDFLIPNPFKGKKHPELFQQLEAIGFKYDFNRSDGSIFFWNADFKIEFIIPAKGAEESKAKKIDKLGISAIPLRYVNMLLKESITIKENNLKIKLPNPINFCLHKLIIASKRREKGKRIKDIQQAVLTSEIVDQNILKEKFSALPTKWKSLIVKSLGIKDTEITTLPRFAILKQLLQTDY